MNLRRTWTVLLLGCCAALLFAAAGASAKPGYFVMSGYHSVELSFKGSHGFRVHIEKRGRRDVVLVASDERSTVGYIARSLAPEGDEVKARFPGVGRVAVRFRPTGPPREINPELIPLCKGGEVVEQHGHFVGTIRFRGEQGYTNAQRRRARGVVKTVSKEVCGPFDESQPDLKTMEFNAFSKSDLRFVGFSALGSTDPDTSTVFSASVAERRRGMEIYRNTFAIGKNGDLGLEDTRPYPLSATVTPPAPFQGSGEFQRDAEGATTWTGSLTVPFPGLGPVTLAGPEFTARLCQRSGCTDNAVDGHSLPWRPPGAVE